MKPKALLPLLIVFAALAVLVVLKQSQKETKELTEQAALKPLVDNELDITTLSRIEFYAGAKPDKKLILTRRDDGEWEITTRYNAPVVESEVMNFLNTVKGFVGEFRATAEETLLNDYDLGDDIGFHALAYNDNSESPVFHIISGKSPDFGSNFMRAGGSNDIYLVDTDLRREAGIYSPEMDARPGSNIWMDKSIFSFDKKNISAISITYPDKSISAQKVVTQKAVEPEEDAEDPEPKMVEEITWKLTGGGLNEEMNDDPFNVLAKRLSTLEGMAVLDPAQEERWGLTEPPYAIKATVEGGDDITIEAARPEFTGPGYLRVTSFEEQHIFGLSKTAFKELFPTGNEFFEMPGILLEQNSINDIKYDTPEGNVHLSKVDGNWKIQGIPSDIPLYGVVTDGIERTISSFQASDYADNRTNSGLDTPTQTIVFSGTGVRHQLSVGNDSLHLDGKYVQLDSNPQTLVLDIDDYTGIFMPPQYIFNRQLFDVKKEKIEYISVNLGETAYTLTMDEEGIWNVQTESDSFEPIESEVDFLLDNLTQLEAEQFVHDTANRQPGTTYGTVKFRLETGKEHLLTVEEEIENQFVARVSGLKSAYVLGKSSITRLFAESESFKPAMEEESSTEELQQ